MTTLKKCREIVMAIRERTQESRWRSRIFVAVTVVWFVGGAHYLKSVVSPPPPVVVQPPPRTARRVDNFYVGEYDDSVTIAVDSVWAFYDDTVNAFLVGQ